MSPEQGAEEVPSPGQEPVGQCRLLLREQASEQDDQEDHGDQICSSTLGQLQGRF